MESQSVFQAKTQAKIFLLNFLPGQRLDDLLPEGRGLLLVLEGAELGVEEVEGGVQRDVDVLGLALLEEARAQVQAQPGEDPADEEVGLGGVVLEVEGAEPRGAEHLEGVEVHGAVAGLEGNVLERGQLQGAVRPQGLLLGVQFGEPGYEGALAVVIDEALRGGNSINFTTNRPKKCPKMSPYQFLRRAGV